MQLYESASQFNREYKRFFGQPPMRDIKVRRLAGSAIGQRLTTVQVILSGWSANRKLSTNGDMGSLAAEEIKLLDRVDSCAQRTQPTATGLRFAKFLACSNANAICSTPQSS
jgi:AraC-like DNA-binding protein